IAWTTTGSNTDIGHFKLYYSTDSGSNWNFIIIVATVSVRSFTWNVPEVDSYTARVRVELVPQSGPSIFAMSNHDFCIFDTIAYNWPPIAMAGPDRTVNEDVLVQLDGSGSYDPNYETLTYTWTKVSPASIDVTLHNPSTARPFFTMSLNSYSVTFVFDLTVSDGIVHTDPILYNTDRVSITILPRPPVITRVLPDTGWVGTPLTIEGSDLKNAEIFIGGVNLGRVLTDPMPPLNPDPDHSYTFTVPSAIPHGKHTITLKTTTVEVTSTDQVEIFPEPLWQFENAPGFHNPTKSSLSYPWTPWHEGRYKDAFGEDVYLKLWICIGLPIWTPWTGWYCLGYEIEEPFAPDPLAAIYYGAVFWWMARNGECFGMSTTALRLYHNEIQPNDYGSYYNARDVPNSGEFREHVDYQQGAQMSAEVLNAYLGNFIGGLVPSSEYTGLGLWANNIKSSIDSGDLGIATLVCGGGAHAVVPYAYEEVDATHTRFYVYDSNREDFSFPDKAIDMCKSGDDHNDNPPYIEVHKSGTYWDWSFRSVDGSMWNSEVGVAFVPWSTVKAHKTMPLSIDGITHLLAGDAAVAIESDNGSRVGYNESGELEFGIDGAAPLPMFSGPGWKAQSWYLPTDNYTATITGTSNGVYNWSAINNGNNAFSIEGAEISASSIDDISVDYPDGNPYRGSMEYGTNDDAKVYTLAQVNRFGNRERVYRIINATLTDTGTHIIGTNDDYSGIRFTNNGNAPTTFDVEFQGNVVSEAVWNGTSRPTAPGLPTASRKGITVQPGQTVVIRPTDWLDLYHAVVIIEGETVPGIPLDLEATINGLNVTLEWDVPASDGGWPVLGYKVYRGEGSDNMTFLTDVTGSPFYDRTVENGKTYHYSVRAMNVLGLSEPSITVSATIPDMTAPGTPSNLILSLDPDGVMVSWAPPTNDGGSPVTGYVVFRSNGTGALSRFVELGDVLTYLDESVVNGTTYRYAVLALNSVGEGPRTAESSIKVPGSPVSDDDDDDDDDDVDDDDDKDDFPWWVLIVVFIMIALVIFVILLITIVFASTIKGPQDEE
ncbi:MAG: fibronectin type III domain-containing protein, partial [Candidatus Thermoplasmatota archaeon]|nr:fibronectin type III domain-containing protein [Candidatus Thermoplasmatota archaeon]